MSINAARPLNPMDTTFRGGYIPGGEQRATQAVDKQVVRITPENRQGLDVMLTPADQKKLFEQGYLDVQRSFTVMESNEGMFSLLGKSLACIVGPSKSIGAIKIDPMFLEMIKDPNAKVGFGYTRVKNETLNVLPSPVAPAATEPTPLPENPAFVPGIQPLTPAQEELRRRAQLENLPDAGTTPVPGGDTFVNTITKSWIETEATDAGHLDTTFSGSNRQYLGAGSDNRDNNYMTMSYYLDQGQYSGATETSPRVDHGTRNAREFANTISTYNNRFLGSEILTNRIGGAYTEYNKPYGFMVLGDMAKEPVKGNADLTRDYVELKVADFQRQNPGATPEAIEGVRTGAQQEVDGATRNKNGISSPNGADVFMLKTQNTMIGSGPETENLRQRYNTLLSERTPAIAPLTNEQFANVSMADFYALQYNAAAATTNGRTPQVSISVGADGRVSGLDATELRSVSNFRVVAETNFGRRVGESMTFGAERVNNYLAAKYPSDPNLSDRQITRADAADLNVDTQTIVNKLEELGLGFTDTATGPGRRLEYDFVVKDKDGNNVTLVPGTPGRGSHQEIQAAYSRMSPANQQRFAGVISQMRQVPSVVRVDQMKAMLDVAKNDGGGVSANTYGRVTRPMNVQGISQDEWKEVLGINGQGGMIQDSDPRARAQADGGQFVIPGSAAGGTTTVTAPADPAVSQIVVNNISQVSQVGTVQDNAQYEAISGQVAELQRRGVDLSKVEVTLPPTDGSSNPTRFNLAQWGTKDSPGPLQNAARTQGGRSLPATVTTASLETAISGNLTILEDAKTKLNSTPKGAVSPQTAVNVMDAVDGQIQQLRSEITALETKTPPAPAAQITELKTKLQAFEARRTEVQRDPEFAKAYTAGRSEAAGLASPTGGYPAQANQTLNQFNDYLKSAIADGKITTDERDKIQGFVDGLARNMGSYLESMGVGKMAGSANMSVGDLKAKLASLDAYELGSPSRLNPAQISTTLETLDRISGAQASVNLSMAEGQYSNSLYQNVRNLSQRLDQFQSVEVAKTAYRGMMTEMATSQPEVFNNMMSVAYGLPAPGTPGTEQAYTDLQNAAKSGSLPFPPNIGFVDRAQLGGANAAYTTLGNDPDNPRRVAGPTILLASDLASQPDLLREAFTEEMFHHLEKNANVQALANMRPDQKARVEQAEAQVVTADNNLRQVLGIEGDDEIPEETDADSAELISARRALSGAQANLSSVRDFDAQGDEGRAALMALRQVQAGNTDLANLGQAADIGRNQHAQVSGNIRRTENNERFDQGTVQRDIVGARGAVLVEAGADLEFSTATGAVEGGASPVQGAQATGARPAAAATGLPPQQMEALRQSFNEAAAEYKPRLQAIDQERETLKQQNRGRVPADDAQRLDQAQQAIEQEMGQRFRQQNNIPMTVNWQRGEIFGSLPSDRVGPQSQATFTTAAYRTSSDPRQADMNHDYRDSGLDVQPLNPNRSMQREMVMHERGGFGETRAAGNFGGMQPNDPRNVNGPDGRPRFNQDLLAFDQRGGSQQASFDTPERFDSKFSEMMHGMWEGIKSSPKYLPDIGSGMEVMGKAFTAYADKWRDQMKELWFGPQGVCKNLSMYSLTAHNVIYGEGGGPGNETDGLKVGDDANEYNFHKTTSQAGLPDYASAQQQVAQRDSQYRSDMRTNMSLKERNSELNQRQGGLGFGPRNA